MSQSWRPLIHKCLLFALTAAMLSLSGCAGSTKFGAAKISSDPEGAEVVNLRDNSHLGTTPVKVSFAGEGDTSEYITIQLQKPGYIDRITSFWINRRHKTAFEADEDAVDISITLEKSPNN